ncbi:YcjF family protein [Neptunitalea lumnitzerae]|uniref:GTPase n=1 Tax=Neptunitalea lumnitzerae TaxID=2965509 RepID=A0ABQ5MIS1_9FLAO|nr:GTPase [Neptunitalea sp. Y10]GLB49307.1 GTPase [Neptunitalea sp. Y10]
MSQLDIGKVVKEAIDKAKTETGNINILIAGKTGVGKSTLINAVFQGNYATTGQGKPVTKSTREIKKEGIPLTLFDTRGMEVSEFETTYSQLEELVKERSKRKNPDEHIHAAWVCIDESSRRIEDAEIQLTKMLASYIPVLGVITKAQADRGFRAIVFEHLKDVKNIIRVNSIDETLDDGYVIKKFGLQELVEATMEIVPEGQHRAFAASQKVSIDIKKKTAHKIVVSAAGIAGSIGATPIPFSDAVALVPVQVTMLAGITSVFGFTLEEGFLKTLIASVITGSGATLIGRSIASNLLKFIPGVGSVAGGIISAGTAAAVTTAFGEAYIQTLAHLLVKKDMKDITQTDILTELKKRFKGKKNNVETN